MGRRLLVLDVMPGHGRDNLQHELELGHAYVTSANRADVVASALAALAAGGGTAPADGGETAPADGGETPLAAGEIAPAHSARDWEAAFSSALAELGLAGPVPGEGC